MYTSRFSMFLLPPSQDRNDDDVFKNLLREDIESLLDTLGPRERDVLRLRYGLDDGRMKTVKEIGQIFNVTSGLIRQLEAKALRKLRKAKLVKKQFRMAKK